jgi:hypothetical protein
MQANRVTSVMNLPEKARDWRIRQAILPVDVVGRVSGHEIEGALKPVALARVHQQTERVERISVDTPCPSIEERSGSICGEARIAPP